MGNLLAKYLISIVIAVIMAATTAVEGRGAEGPPGALTLPQAVETALRHNGLVRAAGEGVAGAEARKKEAFTAFLPRLSTSWAYLRLNDDPWVYSPGYNLNLFGTPVVIPPGPQVIGTKDNYTWNLEFRQPLFAGGAIVAQYRAGQKGEALARAEDEAARQALVEEVKTAYLNCLKAERLLEVARKSVELLEAHSRDAHHFFSVGLIPRNDLLLSEVRLANGRQDLLRAENALELARSRLNVLMGRGVSEAVVLEDILVYSPFAGGLEECLKTARENRPEVRAAALKAEAAGHLVEAARGELFPTLSALGRYERFGDTAALTGSTYRSMENWSLMARADWNFWEWGRTKYRLDAEKARQRQASHLLDQERDRVALEVKAAYLMLREAERQVEITRRAVEQGEENFRVSRERYAEQLTSSTEVLDALTLLTKAKSDHWAALGDYLIGRARLERAMGVVRAP